MGSPRASSASARTAAAAGEASARALPMPTDWDPWPGKTNAIRSMRSVWVSLARAAQRRDGRDLAGPWLVNRFSADHRAARLRLRLAQRLPATSGKRVQVCTYQSLGVDLRPCRSSDRSSPTWGPRPPEGGAGTARARRPGRRPAGGRTAWPASSRRRLPAEAGAAVEGEPVAGRSRTGCEPRAPDEPAPASLRMLRGRPTAVPPHAVADRAQPSGRGIGGPGAALGPGGGGPPPSPEPTRAVGPDRHGSGYLARPGDRLRSPARRAKPGLHPAGRAVRAGRQRHYDRGRPGRCAGPLPVGREPAGRRPGTATADRAQPGRGGSPPADPDDHRARSCPAGPGRPCASAGVPFDRAPSAHRRTRARGHGRRGVIHARHDSSRPADQATPALGKTAGRGCRQ